MLCSWLGPHEYFILGFKRCLQVSFLKLPVESVWSTLEAGQQQEHAAGRGSRVPEALRGRFCLLAGQLAAPREPRTP